VLLQASLMLQGTVMNLLLYNTLQWLQDSKAFFYKAYALSTSRSSSGIYNTPKGYMNDSLQYHTMSYCTCIHYIILYICCRTRGGVLESKDSNRVDSIFLPLLDNFLALVVLFLHLKSFWNFMLCIWSYWNKKWSLFYLSFVFFNELEVHVGDMHRIMETKGWPMDELWSMWHFKN